MATDTQVLVVGAGPAGLFMAAELNRHGVSCRIVDKNDGPTHDSRAASIQARTLEILDSVGLADEFVQVGNICHAAATFAFGKERQPHELRPQYSCSRTS
jgi:2-polyprenyl-6-methoxyphenol hydroxylase-like FAD-dependent oxidoreductase